MVDEDRPATEAEGIASDSRYFGPFGEPPPTSSSADASYEPVPTFESHTFAWPPPSGEPPRAGGLAEALLRRPRWPRGPNAAGLVRPQSSRSLPLPPS